MTNPPALMRKLSNASDASDTVRKESNASDAPSNASNAPTARETSIVARRTKATAARKEIESDASKPWEAPAWRAHCAQEREAARQVIPYESDLVEGLAARYGCVASGDGTDERPAPERSDEDMWHATVDSLADLKRACQDYGISAMKSKEQLAARIYHPDQPGQKEKRRRLKAPTASGGDP